MLLTEELLKSSQEFKDWTKGDKIVLIHNCYFDSKEPYGTYIVIHTQDLDDRFSITRFFMGGLLTDKIQVSVDYTDLLQEEVFKLLLSEYSRGLK